MSRFNLRKLVFKNQGEVLAFNEKFIHSEAYGANYMRYKYGSINILAENVSVPACHILKEAMLSLGGEAAVHRDILVTKEGKFSLLLMGTPAIFSVLAKKVKPQAFALSQFAEELVALLAAPEPRSQRTIPYHGGELRFGQKTLVMGILNCTPDSFSDGGQWFDVERAVEHGLTMEREGADIIDIGGESTRPGSDKVSAEEEMRRVIPVIEKLKEKLTIPISIDSYKAVTVRGALEAGATIINDIWGLQGDPDMAQVGAEYQCPIIIMHNKTAPIYDNFMSKVLSFLRRSIDMGEEAGCKREQFIVDPGFGFGKEREHNLCISKYLSELSVLGCPILMAASRKKTLGLVLDAPAQERLEGDAALTAMAIANGADMVRVHDVKEMAKVAKMADALMAANYL